jgi:hypothetical protein
MKSFYFSRCPLEVLTNNAYPDVIHNDLIDWIKDLMESNGFLFRDGVFYQGSGPWLECGKAPFFKRQLTANGARLVYPTEKPHN